MQGPVAFGTGLGNHEVEGSPAVFSFYFYFGTFGLFHVRYNKLEPAIWFHFV